MKRINETLPASREEIQSRIQIKIVSKISKCLRHRYLGCGNMIFKRGENIIACLIQQYHEQSCHYCYNGTFREQIIKS